MEQPKMSCHKKIKMIAGERRRKKSRSPSPPPEDSVEYKEIEKIALETFYKIYYEYYRTRDIDFKKFKKGQISASDIKGKYTELKKKV